MRLFLLIEAVSFAAASLFHFGVLVTGYEHPGARIPEAVIAAVLFAGLLVSLIRAGWTRWAALVAQGFALLGTMVGLFVIAIGVGPRTPPDLAFHAFFVVTLVWGLIVAWRSRSSSRSHRP
jgi:hypothetical protein